MSRMKLSCPLLPLWSLQLAALLIATVAIAQDQSAQRVGGWEVTKGATLAIAADPHGPTVHIIFGDAGELRHSHSVDGGTNWSEPQRIGRGTGQDAALDSTGTLHLVSESNGMTAMTYRSFRDGAWSEPRDITARVGERDAMLYAPRLAIDGGGNLHLLYWTLWKGREIWKEGSRTAYWYLPHGATEFAPVEMWRGEGENGYGRYGAIAIDPRGDAHLFYSSSKGINRHYIERRVRHQDGSWGQHDTWLGKLLCDWCIGADIGPDGVAHLAVQTKIPDAENNDTLRVVCLSDRGATDKLTQEHDLGWESYETFSDLKASANGDLWIATGHLEEKGPHPGEPPEESANIASICRFDASTQTWSERTPLSPAGAVNLDSRRSNGPRLVIGNGLLWVYYAEKLPGETWRHQRRNLGTWPGPQHAQDRK